MCTIILRGQFSYLPFHRCGKWRLREGNCWSKGGESRTSNPGLIQKPLLFPLGNAATVRNMKSRAQENHKRCHERSGTGCESEGPSIQLETTFPQDPLGHQFCLQPSFQTIRWPCNTLTPTSLLTFTPLLCVFIVYVFKPRRHYCCSQDPFSFIHVLSPLHGSSPPAPLSVHLGPSSSAWRPFFRISFNVGLLPMILSGFISRDAFISLLNSKNIVPGHRILDCEFFSFSTLKIFYLSSDFHCFS